MKIIKGNFGECRIIDNMDEKHGLPSLKTKSWDLCLQDPPYGYKIQNKDGCIGGNNFGKTKKYHLTNNDKYTIKQHNECIRITNNQVIWGSEY